MAEYIEREALLTEVKEKYRDINGGCYPFNIVAYDMAQMVENFPAADVVKVVHCRDCKYHHYICPSNFLDRKADDFCSYGERRSNEN